MLLRTRRGSENKLVATPEEKVRGGEIISCVGEKTRLRGVGELILWVWKGVGGLGSKEKTASTFPQS